MISEKYIILQNMIDYKIMIKLNFSVGLDCISKLL